MSIKKFSIREALKFGWNSAINHIGFFVVALLGSWIAMLVPQFLAGAAANHGGSIIVAVLLSALNLVVGLLVGLGLIKSSLKIMDGGEAGMADFIPTSKQFWTFLLASLACGIAVFIGFILVIIPGIILGIGLRFYPFFVVEKNMGPIESLRASWESTKGVKFDVFLLLLTDLLIVIAGAILLGVGLFLAIPIVLMSQAYVYRKIVGTPAVTVTEVA